MQLPEGLALLPFQQEDLDTWVSLPRPRTLWNCNDMSLGKTVDAVCCARACDYARILVVAPKSMRPEWQAAFARWWPEREQAAEIDKGFTRKSMSEPERFRLQAKLENPTHIVSPELLPKLVGLHQIEAAAAPGEYTTLHPYDYVVFDEFHECRSFWSKQFQALLALRALYPMADLKPLSGTPMGADPLKAWSWLKLSEPKKWGTLKGAEEVPFVFRKMYGERKESEYAYSGFSYSGVNKDKLPQFREVTRHLIRRRTVAEVGLQLPAMRFEIKRYAMDTNPEAAAAEWAARAVGEQPVAVFTHNIDPLDRIEGELQALKVPYVRIYQEQSTPERAALVGQAIRTNAAILATTGLVSTGVNYLADIRTWLLAQPCENPVEIQQLAKRFTRLSSKDKLPRVGYLLYREGEEFSAQKALAKRLQTDKALVSQSAESQELERIIDGRSGQTLLDTLRLLGRSYAAHAADDDEEEDDAA